MSLLSKPLRSLFVIGLSLAGALLAIGLAAIPVSRAAPAPAPILVVTNSAYTQNKFGAYLGEILRAEGLNAYDSADLSAITLSYLKDYTVTVLAETSLSPAQAQAFTDYVAGGGRLIAMRPDAQIKSLFGLGTAAALSQTDGYLKLAAGPTTTAGLTTSPLQIHVQTDHYNLAGGETLAELYSTPTTATGFPAVARGSAGRAVAFTYDLAQNIAYLRQGNPALANRVDTTLVFSGGVPFNWDTANPPVTRTVHLFGSPDITNSVPLWIDRDLIPVPQADEQMRLLARLVKEQIEATRPMPQLWYFPGPTKTMLILTGDAHANPALTFSTEITSLVNRQAPISLYMSIGGGVTEADLLNWQAQGHTFGIHPYAYKSDPDPRFQVNNLTEGFALISDWFAQSYPLVTRSRTIRNHQVAWQGWTDAADLAAAYGLALDTNFYVWGEWLQKANGTWPHGYMTGSGQPMKFIRSDGTVLPIYQQLTELVDEQLLSNVGSGYEDLDTARGLVVSRDLINASQAGDYAALMTQFHVDYYSGGAQLWAEGTVDYARSLGIPIWNADQWLEFTETRHDANYTELAWNNETRTLTFTLTASNTAGITLTTLLPAAYQGYGLTSVQVDTVVTSTIPLTVKNQSQAAVLTSGGIHTFVASYNSPLPGGTQTQTLADDFGAVCATLTGTHASDLNNGSLVLNGLEAGDDFSALSLDAGMWASGPWHGGGYTPSQSGGVLIVPGGGWVRSTAAQLRGILEVNASFGMGDKQLLGLASPTFDNDAKFMFFSTFNPSGGAFDGRLWARANNGGSEQNLSLGPIPAGLHRYRIEWTTLDVSNDQVTFYIDGKYMAQFNLATSGLAVFDTYFSNDGAVNLQVDWVHRTPNHVGFGTYRSCVLDAGVDYAWNTVRWDPSLPANTALTVETRTSFDNAAWSPWAPATAPAGTALARAERYAQYRVTLATTDILTTPALNAIAFDYAAQTLALAKSDGGVSPTIGQAVPFTLTLTVPATTTHGLWIADTLPAGYIFTAAGMTVTGLSSGPALTPVVSDPNDGTAPVTVSWNLGTVVAATDTVRLIYTATVANVASNQAGVTLTNTTQVVNHNSFGADQPPLTATASLTLREPALLITKTALAPAGQVYPGGVTSYQVVIGHPGGVNTSPAYDLVVTDVLPAQLQLAGPITVSAGGSNASAGNTLTVTAATLAAGSQITVTYPVTLSTGLTSGQSLNNTATATWTSQPGSVAQERTGAGGLDDYRVASSAAMTVSTPALSLGVGGSVASLPPSQTIVYSLLVTNTSPVPASGVALTATLPATLTIQSVSNGGNASLGVATWPAFTVAGNTSVLRTVTAQLNTPVEAGLTQVVITAAVRDDHAHGAELSLADNDATTSTSVDAKPDLRLVISDGGATVAPGAAVTYTLTYSNAGDQGATGVEVTATVPANTTFLQAGSDSGWSCANGDPAGTLCQKSLGAFAGGGASGSPLKFVVTVSNPVPAGALAVALTAVLGDDGANGPDLSAGNNTATDSTPITAAPNLGVAVSDGGQSGFPGEPITYTVTYSNTGNRGASGVALSTTVPLNTLFSAARSAPGWTCANGSGAGTVCQNPLGIVAGGGAATVAVPFVVVVDIPMPAGGNTITATVAISDNVSNGTDPVPGNNHASDSTPLLSAPNLALALQAPASTAPGEVLSYTVAYSNTGNQGVAGLVITMTVPNGTLFIPARSRPGWVCPTNAAGAVCTWTRSNLLLGGGTGEVVTFTVAVTAPAPAGLNVIAGQAVISDTTNGGTPEHSLADNTALTTTVLQAAPNLGVSVTAGVNSVTPGGAVTYTLAYSNTGNQDATGVSLTATVPADAVYTAGTSTPGWTCAAGGSAGAACTWTSGALGSGQSGAPVVFGVGALNPVAAGATALTFSARIGDDGANGPDPASGNNLAQVATPLTDAAADLTLIVKGGAAPVTVGSVVVYDVAYTNLGNRGASGVVVTATLPAGTTLDNAGSTPGWVCTTGTCTYAVGEVAGGGAGGSVLLALQTAGVAAPSEIQLQTRIGDDGLNGEATPNNNTATQTTPVIPAISNVYLPLIARGG